MPVAEDAVPASVPEAKRLKVFLRGAVQGVGFRPFIYRLAQELGLTGWVNNSSQGVNVEVEGSAAPITANRSMMRDVFLELLTNSFSARGAGLSVDIRVRTLHKGIANPLHEGDVLAADTVYVSYHDNGPGIPDESRSQIFKRLFSTKPGGRGLGLASILYFLELHGGEVQEMGAAGLGAEFGILLPLVADGGENA